MARPAMLPPDVERPPHKPVGPMPPMAPPGVERRPGPNALPPGLARRATLPHGLAKRATLPPGLLNRSSSTGPLPPDVVAKLNQIHGGTGPKKMRPPLRVGMGMPVPDEDVRRLGQQRALQAFAQGIASSAPRRFGY